MTSLEKPDVGTSSVRWRFPSVHPEGRKFVLIAAAITLVFAFLSWETQTRVMAAAMSANLRPSGWTDGKRQRTVVLPTPGFSDEVMRAF